MKTIIAGCRNINDYDLVKKVIEESKFEITSVVCGGCRGVDNLGAVWAEAYMIPIHHYLADWDKFGRAAGPIRNRNMASESDALIAIWDGKSRGTKNMIEEAISHGLKVFIKEVNNGTI